MIRSSACPWWPTDRSGPSPEIALIKRRSYTTRRGTIDIDGCLDVLFEKRDALLESLPTSGSATLASILARLAVAERLIWRDEHPEAHALIAGARRDLTIVSAADSHRLLTPPARPGVDAPSSAANHQDFHG